MTGRNITRVLVATTIILVLASMVCVQSVSAAWATVTATVGQGGIQSHAITTISYTLANVSNGKTTIAINDSYGLTVWSKYEGLKNAGTYYETWDGTFTNGTLVPDGRYDIIITVQMENRTLGTTGSWGSGDYQFYTTGGVAADGNGNIYVTDYGNHRVQVFNNAGTLIRTLGTTGSPGPGDDQFLCPIGIVVDDNGNIYVADAGNDRVQVFNSASTLIRTLGTTGSPGSGDDHFYDPNAVVVDDSGNIYVADSLNHRVQVFNNAGTLIRTLGSPGSGDNQFIRPAGVAVDATGNIYVADAGNDRVQVFNNAGTLTSTFGTTGSWGTGDGQFNQPCGVAVGDSGNIYVADSGNHRVQVFNNAGTLIRTLGTTGSPGTGDGQFNMPNGVALDDSGNIYVADTENHRVRIFYADTAGNTSIYVDNVAPAVTCSPDGPLVNGWYMGSVSVTLDADDPGGSGVSSTERSMDSVSWQPYTGAYIITTEGTNTLYWRCRDNAGNTATGDRTINVDMSAGKVSYLLIGGRSAQGWFTGDVLADFSPTVAAGLPWINCSRDNSSWTPYTGQVHVPYGSSPLYYRILTPYGNTLYGSIPFTYYIFNPTPMPAITASPVPATILTPTPGAAPSTTPGPTLAGTPTPVPAATPGEPVQGLPGSLYLIVILVVIAAIGAVYLFRSRR